MVLRKKNLYNCFIYSPTFHKYIYCSILYLTVYIERKTLLQFQKNLFSPKLLTTWMEAYCLRNISIKILFWFVELVAWIFKFWPCVISVKEPISYYLLIVLFFTVLIIHRQELDLHYNGYFVIFIEPYILYHICIVFMQLSELTDTI